MPIPALRILRDRLRALWRPDRVRAEIDDELRFHLDMRAQENIRRGLPATEAVQAASRRFGHFSSIKEFAYDVRGGGWIESTLQDLRYALRGLRARPTFTIGVALTLGLGIGANAAMFNILDRLLLRPPPFLRDPSLVHRVYQTWTTSEGAPRLTRGVRYPRYVEFQRFTHSFSPLAAFALRRFPVGDGDNVRERVVTAANASYFDLFAMRPALGRFFTPDDDRAPAGAPVVVLSHGYWQSEYGGRPDALGKRIKVGRTLCTIIGVAPAGFIGLDQKQSNTALYVPVTTYAWDQRGADVRAGYDYTKDYGWGFGLEMVVRRPAGMRLELATSELTAAFVHAWRVNDEATARRTTIEQARPAVILGPIQVERGPEEARPEAKILIWVTGVAFVVLLIACANVANLLLARAVTRRREIGLRLALGVSRLRLLRQLLSESLVLALIGGMVGLVLAQSSGTVLRAFFLPGDTAAGVFDMRTLVFASVVTIGVAVVTGLAPLAHALRTELSLSPQVGGHEAGAPRSRLRTVLLVMQATLSVVLLVGAGLFVRSLHNVRTAELGFDVDPLVVITETFRENKPAASAQIALERRLVDEVRAIPGVVAATRSPSIPYTSFLGRGLWVAGVDSVMKLGNFLMQSGDADFFRTYGARILRGRAFDDRDGATPPGVVVVGERMAKTLWPKTDPLGQCLRIAKASAPAAEATAPCAVVIGVAEEMHINSLREASRTNEDEPGKRDYTYTIPIGQYEYPADAIVARVEGDAAEFTTLLRQRLQPLMPGGAYVTVVPLRTILDTQMQSWRMGATMFTAFASLALALAAVGLYSVIAYGVAQRRREISVRIALGASQSHVVRLVVGGGLQLVAVGVAIGLLLARGTSRWIGPLLFEEAPTDPFVYAAVAAILLGVAVLAAAIPAMAAARVDPNSALRAD